MGGGCTPCHTQKSILAIIIEKGERERRNQPHGVEVSHSYYMCHVPLACITPWVSWKYTNYTGDNEGNWKCKSWFDFTYSNTHVLVVRFLSPLNLEPIEVNTKYICHECSLPPSILPADVCGIHCTDWCQCNLTEVKPWHNIPRWQISASSSSITNHCACLRGRQPTTWFPWHMYRPTIVRVCGPLHFLVSLILSLTRLQYPVDND